MTTLLHLGPERMTQLQEIAAKRGITPGEQIGRWISAEIAAGFIAPGIKGVTVERDSAGTLVVRLGKVERNLDTVAGRDLAATLRSVSGFDRDAETVHAIIRDARADIARTSERLGLVIRRQGAGISIRDPRTDEKFSTSPAVAQDIAELIEEAAE